MNISLKEAQEQLPQLLERVERGEQVTITRDGKPGIALSVSQGALPRDPEQIRQAIAEIRELRRGMQISPEEIKELINEGRRF